LFNKGLVRLAAISLIVGCTALIINIEQDCTEKESQLAAVQEKIDAYEAENMELQRVLDSGDLSSYMEKIAIEERGYAYPDERRFYDTSRD
jgi:cell division protein FtsB